MTTSGLDPEVGVVNSLIAPVVIPLRLPLVIEYCLVNPAGVTEPTVPLPTSVNHTFPSGPRGCCWK